MSQQPPPPRTALIDKIFRSRPTRLCPHVPPRRSQPIYIVSYRVFKANSAAYLNTKFTHTQEPNDPVFVFSWLDNVILQSKTPPGQKKYPVVLKIMSHLSRARAWEGPKRHKAEGLYPGHIYEDSTNWQDFELLDANGLEDSFPDDQNHLRYSSYMSLVTTLRQQYSNPITIMLSSDADDQAILDSISEAKAKSTNPLFPDVETCRDPTQLFGQSGAQAVKPPPFTRWDKMPLPLSAPDHVTAPFALCLDSNSIQFVPPKTKQQKTNLHEFVKYAAMASDARHGLAVQRVAIADTVLAEKTATPRGKVPDGFADLVTTVDRLRNGHFPGVDQAVDYKPIEPIPEISAFINKPALLPDTLIRLKLQKYAADKGAIPLILSRDAGMATSLWHLGLPVVYWDSDTWNIPENARDLVPWLDEIAKAYLCCPGQPFWPGTAATAASHPKGAGSPPRRPAASGDAVGASRLTERTPTPPWSTTTDVRSPHELLGTMRSLHVTPPHDPHPRPAAYPSAAGTNAFPPAMPVHNPAPPASRPNPRTPMRSSSAPYPEEVGIPRFPPRRGASVDEHPQPMWGDSSRPRQFAHIWPQPGPSLGDGRPNAGHGGYVERSQPPPTGSRGIHPDVSMRQMTHNPPYQSRSVGSQPRSLPHPTRGPADRRLYPQVEPSHQPWSADSNMNTPRRGRLAAAFCCGRGGPPDVDDPYAHGPGAERWAVTHKDQHRSKRVRAKGKIGAAFCCRTSHVPDDQYDYGAYRTRKSKWGAAFRRSSAGHGAERPHRDGHRKEPVGHGRRPKRRRRMGTAFCCGRNSSGCISPDAANMYPTAIKAEKRAKLAAACCRPRRDGQFEQFEYV